MINNLIKRLEELSADANRESQNYLGISSELSEYHLGYSEGIIEAIELIHIYIKEEK